MKKKIGIILAVLLCMALVFTFVACNGGGEDGIPGVTAEQITAKKAAVGSYLDSWLAQHAEENITNQSNALTADLEKQAAFSFTDDSNASVKPTFSVSFKNNTYTITVSWNKGAVKETYTKSAQSSKYSHWAGASTRTADYTRVLTETAASDILDSIIVAFVSTANDVTGNAITGKFSVDLTTGLEVLDVRYGLRVKGNIDVESAKDTELGLVIVDENKNELGGLYYKGATTTAESKIYLQYALKDGDKLKREDGEIVYGYKYINYADVLGWISRILPEDLIQEEATDGVFPDDIETFSDFCDIFGFKSGDLVTGIIDMLADGYANEDEGKYLIDVNLASVLDQVTELIAGFGLDSEEIPFLDAIGLDLSSMYGLRGHISISATMPDEETLTALEIAVNIPDDTIFHFSDKADAFSFEIPPVSFSIFIDDFSFVSDDTIDVMPELPERVGYFSPTNLDVSGNVYINHTEGDDEMLDDTFHFEFVTDINPLEILANGIDSKARAALVIKQSQGKVYDAQTATNFLSISYEQETKTVCVSGTAFGLDNGETVYKFVVNSKDEALSAIDKWLGFTNYQGWMWDDEKGYYIVYKQDGTTIAQPSLRALLENTLAENLMKYYAEKHAEKNATDEQTSNAEFSFADIGSYFDAFKELYETFEEDGVIDIDVDHASVHVTPAVINQVTSLINSTFDVTLPTDINDPEFVNVEINSENYEDMVFISVKYAGNTYELLFNGHEENKFTITFTMKTAKNRSYIVKFDAMDEVETESATKWTASVIVEIKDADGNVVNSTEVTLSDFHAEWGNDNGDEVTALIPNAAAKEAALPLFPENGTGPATELVKGLMKALNIEAVEGTAEKIGKFIIRQIMAD